MSVLRLQIVLLLTFATGHLRAAQTVEFDGNNYASTLLRIELPTTLTVAEFGGGNGRDTLLKMPYDPARPFRNPGYKGPEFHLSSEVLLLNPDDTSSAIFYNQIIAGKQQDRINLQGGKVGSPVHDAGSYAVHLLLFALAAPAAPTQGDRIYWETGYIPPDMRSRYALVCDGRLYLSQYATLGTPRGATLDPVSTLWALHDPGLPTDRDIPSIKPGTSPDDHPLEFSVRAADLRHVTHVGLYVEDEVLGVTNGRSINIRAFTASLSDARP